MFEKRLRTINKNKKLLLQYAGYKSIQEARKNNVGFTDKEIYEGLREDYNDEVDLIQEQIKESEPKFVKQTLLDKVKFFTKYNFEYKNVNTYEQFYKVIQDALKKFPTATSLSIYIRDKVSGNKVRAISIIRSDLYSFDDFMNALNAIIEGAMSQYGSDAVNLDENELIFNNFGLASAVIAGNGTSDKMLFNTLNIQQTETKVGKKTVKNNDCGKKCLWECLKNTQHSTLISYMKPELVRNVDNMVEFIKVNQLPISVMCNSFLLKRPHNEIVEDNMITIDVFDKKKKRDIKRKATLLQQKDIKIAYFHNCLFSKYTIIFDEFNNHYDVIDGSITLKEIYLTAECYVVMNIEDKNEVIFQPKQMNKNSRTDKKVYHKFVFFDYETVIDFEKNSCMREYSLSILVLDNTELEILTNCDEGKEEEKVKKIREDKCITFLGYDCSIQFINWIMANQEDTAFMFIGFNNANFDNFILLDALLRNNTYEYGIENIFYNGSQLLNFFMNGRHNCFDIHKHLMGSLKANCDSFKINCCAKKSFNHDKAQQLFLNGGLIDFITGNDELKEYNEYDVLATAVLFCKYRRALSEIEATKEYAPMLHDIKTIGSLIYKVFEKSKIDKGFKLSQLTLEEYNNLQNSKIAGRVELFNGVQKVEERLVSTDVCSLYPYVMSVAPVYYPCGEKIYTDVYVPDKIGFYYCDIDQSKLRSMNLPKIYAKKTKVENDWGHEEVLENYLISNVMIELLKKFNCGVVIKSGFYFKDKMKSCEMFNFLLDFMKAKNEQDTKKKDKDSSYNPAMRETLKLLMNSLSGKVIEGLHTEKTTGIDSVAEYSNIVEKSTKINTINTIGNKIFVTYEIDEEIAVKKQRPIYLGVLIYDYAKSYMYENSYSKVGLDELLYTDTDASKFRYSRFIHWKNWVDENNIQVPHWKEIELIDERYKNHRIYESDSKVFGSFEDELEDMVGDNYVFYCVEKKSWCYSVDGKSKFRFKGLNGSALLLSLGEDFIRHKTIKHTKNGISWKEDKVYIDAPEIDVYNFANENKHLAIENDAVKFYEQLYTTGESYLLCSSFRKIVKNASYNVSLGEEHKYNRLMNKVQVNFMLKHIKIQK